MREASSHALAYLQNYIKMNAEPVPTTGKSKLRQSVSWEQLFDRYCASPDTLEYFELHPNSKPISFSTFLRLFHLHFSDVIATRRTPLRNGDTCFTMQEKLHSEALRLRERQFLRDELHDHLQLVEAERAEYHYARTSATPLSGTLSIIFDGARTIGFPRLYPTPKMFASTERLQLPMFSLQCHTFHERRLYFSPPASFHGSNFVISSLALFLAALIQHHNYVLPHRQLRLQCDNASEDSAVLL